MKIGTGQSVGSPEVSIPAACLRNIEGERPGDENRENRAIKNDGRKIKSRSGSRVVYQR